MMFWSVFMRKTAVISDFNVSFVQLCLNHQMPGPPDVGDELAMLCMGGEL